MRVVFEYQGRIVSGEVLAYFADDTVLVYLDKDCTQEWDDQQVFVPNSCLLQSPTLPDTSRVGEKRKIDTPESENGFKKRK